MEANQIKIKVRSSAGPQETREVYVRVDWSIQLLKSYLCEEVFANSLLYTETKLFVGIRELKDSETVQENAVGK